MGTSSPFGGAGGHTPLIPSWLQQGEGAKAPDGQLGPEQSRPQNNPAPNAAQPNQVSPAKPTSNRFRDSRGNYTRFASSGGVDRQSLGKALSGYVRQGTGGARRASTRMGISRNVASTTARLFADIQREGVREALFHWGIEYDGHRSASDVLLELLNRMSFDGGPIDEAIARDSMVDSIINNLADLKVSFEEIDPAVYGFLLEDFVTKSIVSKAIVDIGTKGLYVAKDETAASYIQEQLEEMVRGAVSDAFSINGGIEQVTASEFDVVVEQIYTDAYTIIQAFEDAI